MLFKEKNSLLDYWKAHMQRNWNIPLYINPSMFSPWQSNSKEPSINQPDLLLPCVCFLATSGVVHCLIYYTLPCYLLHFIFLLLIKSFANKKLTRVIFKKTVIQNQPTWIIFLCIFKYLGHKVTSYFVYTLCKPRVQIYPEYKHTLSLSPFTELLKFLFFLLTLALP